MAVIVAAFRPCFVFATLFDPNTRETRRAASNEAVAQHPSHPTGTLLRKEPRDGSAFCNAREVPNGASVRVSGSTLVDTLVFGTQQ